MREGPDGNHFFHTMDHITRREETHPADLESSDDLQQQTSRDSLTQPEKRSGSIFAQALSEAVQQTRDEAEQKNKLGEELRTATQKKLETLARKKKKRDEIFADVYAILKEEPKTEAEKQYVQSKKEQERKKLAPEALRDVKKNVSLLGSVRQKRSDEEIEQASNILTQETGYAAEEPVSSRVRKALDEILEENKQPKQESNYDDALAAVHAILKEEPKTEAEKKYVALQRIKGLIDLFGPQLLKKKYNLTIPKIDSLSEDEITTLDRRLKGIQKEENKEMDRLYQKAEADRANRADRERPQMSQVKTSTYEPKPQESIIVDDLDAMNAEEENMLWDEKIRLAKEIEAYMRDNFDAPLAESDKLIAQAEKDKERMQKEQAILQQWREKIPQMSLETLKANAKHAFDIDLNDQTQEGLTKVAELVNLATVRGEIFTMLYDRFVEMRITQQRSEQAEERQFQTARQEIGAASSEMRSLIDRIGNKLTWPQQQEMQQIYKEKAEAEARGDVPKTLEIIERATNTLKRFERLYEQLKKTGALKTSTPPTIKPPGLFSRIKSFFGGSKK